MHFVDDERWRWKLRLFVSTDLVGSTAFKAAKPDASWSLTFKEFFSDFPGFLSMGYQSINGIKGILQISDAKLQTWKFSGDEILFWVELKDYREVISHLLAVKYAISEFPTEWAAKGVPLKLKATAWLAGFPVTNTEISLPTCDAGGEEGHVLDFIGPSIDLGFRLTRFCNERQFVISADLALMILDAVDTTELDREHFHLHLHNCEVLKGVISNQEYPVFWIDMRNGKPLIQERLLGIQREFHSDDIKDYLRSFIDVNEHLRRPFIEGDQDSRYGSVCEHLMSVRVDMQVEESNREYLIDGEEEKPTQEPERLPKEPAHSPCPPEES